MGLCRHDGSKRVAQSSMTLVPSYKGSRYYTAKLIASIATVCRSRMLGNFGGLLEVEGEEGRLRAPKFRPGEMAQFSPTARRRRSTANSKSFQGAAYSSFSGSKD